MAKQKKSGGIRLKGDAVVYHHLFKSDIATFLKNVSFKKGQPKIEEIEHKHFFHSISSQLKPQQYTDISAGHFHEVIWKTDATGQPVAECGPPLVLKYVTKPSGQRRTYVEVKYHDAENDRYIVDEHTHEMFYVHSEELRAGNARAVKEDTLIDLARKTIADEGIELI